jgi:DNA-binding helix-hairpin-helix protein with protein kinase domain
MTTITTQQGNYKLGKVLYSGGQGDIYMIEGQSRVAKIYTNLRSQEVAEQQHRLQRMVGDGPPSPAFVWPLEVIQKPSLGYIMEFISGYVEFGKLGRSDYLSKVDLRTRLRICYRLVEAFEKLHLKAGYAYCDLSGNNILCNIETGDVKIIDNDNLWVEGLVAPSSVQGTYRCMAPELESQKIGHPNVETDLHSIAVLLFMTLLFHHPLLGDDVHDDSLKEDKALGAGAIYIYNPTDARNRYTRYQDYGGIPISTLPESLRRLFQDSFVEGLHKPNIRVRETNWKKEIINQLDSLVRCPNPQCLGKQTFLPQPAITKQIECIWCKTIINTIDLMKITNPTTPNRALRYKVIYDGDKLSAHHCKLNQTFNFLSSGVCAGIEHDPNHGLTLRNLSNEDFSYYQPNDATPRPFPPNKRIRLALGYKVVFGANGVAAEMIV